MLNTNKIYFTLFILALLLSLLLTVNKKNLAAQDDDYRVGIEDKLYISVWENEQLTGVVSVRLDGKISFPLIGELRVEGYSCQEITQLITNKLTSYVPKMGDKPHYS